MRKTLTGRRRLARSRRNVSDLASAGPWVTAAFGNVYMNLKLTATVTSTARKRPTLSAAGRKRIAAAQRARWAKVRPTRKSKSRANMSFL